MIDAAILTEAMTAQLNSLYWISYSILHVQQDAQDAVQQGLLKAWAHRDTARPDQIRAWLTRIVINECRNIQRDRMRHAVPLPADTQAGSYAMPDADVAAAVAALPDRLRIPFLLKYLMDYTEKEIGQTLRMPVHTVKNRLYKARASLREALSEKEVIGR